MTNPSEPQSRPLVSVVMPVFNGERTIGVALYSLICQTYTHWECIVVDDGSTDHTVNVVESFQDSRIRLVRLEKNMGRGVARQTALEHAAGDYLAMLDADDWIYPRKLEQQIDVFFAYPDVSLVSTGMAIVDSNNSLIGVRCSGDGRRQFCVNRAIVPVAHAPSMLKLKEIAPLTYDSRFRLAQDVDFLRRFLPGKYFVILPDVLYSYSELESVTVKKVTRGHLYNSLGMAKHFFAAPMEIGFEILKAFLKIGYVYSLAVVGRFDRLLKSRSIPPTTQQYRDFDEALRTVFP